MPKDGNALSQYGGGWKQVRDEKEFKFGFLGTDACHDRIQDGIACSDTNQLSGRPKHGAPSSSIVLSISLTPEAFQNAQDTDDMYVASVPQPRPIDQKGIQTDLNRKEPAQRPSREPGTEDHPRENLSPERE